MSCARHKPERLADRLFQLRPGSAWMVAWCPNCGDMDFTVRNPHRNESMIDQPEPA